MSGIVKKLENKVAIVTGGTSGIGKASAQILADNGARVVIAGRNRERGMAAVDEIRNRLSTEGDDIVFIPCDVTNETEVALLIEETVKRFGRIDILFNNSGIMLPSNEIERMSVQDWNTTFNVNITGTFLVTRYARPYLKESRGVILNNASIAGLHSYATGRSYAYSASKAAVIQFSHQMAKNYAEEGIRVNCICPGIIHTPILGDRDPEEYVKRIPLGRIGIPEDVAKAVLFLVSEDSGYITGAVVPIDGGVAL